MAVRKKKRRSGLPGLAALRKQAGLSQSDLAEKLDVVVTAVSHWENGKAAPPSSRLPLVASILRCTIDDLFREAA